MMLRLREEHGKDVFDAPSSFSGDFPQESRTGFPGQLVVGIDISWRMIE
jgi:hypothetical protein